MVIFINGSINAGKSTVSLILQERLGNAALVEVDSLREFISWMPIDDSLPLNHQNALSVIRNFVQAGLHVIVPYPLTKDSYEEIMRGLRDLRVDVAAFTLDPGLDNVLRDRGTRVLSDAERARIRYHYELGIADPGYGKVLDTSNKTPEQTVAEILTALPQA